MAGERLLQIVILGIGIFPGLIGRLTNGQQHGWCRAEPALIGADARRDLAAVLTLERLRANEGDGSRQGLDEWREA